MLVPIGLLFMRQVLQKYHGHGKLVVIASLIFGGPIGHGLCLLLPKLFFLTHDDARAPAAAASEVI